ncbi:MAG: hypothetical protein K2Q32_07975 [Alphaproteobacteria bacterium]|nr:hypothetical protein [Alphaproteobacteria bacterium]
MSSLSLRQQLLKGTRPSSGDVALDQYAQMQAMGLGAFGARRLDAFGPPYAVIPVTKGQPVIVRFGPDFDGKRDNFDDVLAYAAGKGLMGSKEALDTRGGVINIGRDNPRERVRHRNAIAVNHRRPVVGQHTDMARDVSATGAKSRGNIHIPGSRLGALDIRGYGGSISGAFEVNNAKMAGAAIRVKGSGQPVLHDPIGSFKVDGIYVGDMAESTAHALTAERFDYAQHGISGGFMPSKAAVKHYTISHLTLGAPHTLRASLARNAAAFVPQTGGSIKPRNEHELEIKAQYPRPQMA